MTLSKMEQAAVVLANLPRAEAQQVIAQLDPRQAANVERALASNLASQVDQRATLLEFLALERRTLATDPVALLNDADPQAIARCLAHERPTTIALVLSHLPSVMLGQVLATLSSEQQLDVRSLLSRWRGADAQIVALVFDTLARRLAAEGLSSAQPMRQAQTVWNRFARATAS